MALTSLNGWQSIVYHHWSRNDRIPNHQGNFCDEGGSERILSTHNMDVLDKSLKLEKEVDRLIEDYFRSKQLSLF